MVIIAPVQLTYFVMALCTPFREHKSIVMALYVSFRIIEKVLQLICWHIDPFAF